MKRKEIKENIIEFSKPIVLKDGRCINKNFSSVDIYQMIFYLKRNVLISEWLANYILMRKNFMHLPYCIFISVCICPVVLLSLPIAVLLFPNLRVSLKPFVTLYSELPHSVALLLFLIVLTAVFLFPMKKS